MKPIEYYHNKYWQFCTVNPYVLKAQHAGLYFYIISTAAALGTESYGLPAYNAMLHIGMKDYKAYSSCLKKLIACKLLWVKEVSKNQYTATVIAIEENTKANKNAMGENTIANKNGMEKNTTPNNDNKSKKQSILDTKEHMKNIWCGGKNSENPTILYDVDNLKITTTGENALVVSTTPFIKIPTINDYKNNTLKNVAFTKEFLGVFQKDEWLPLWLEVFNKRIEFTGALHRSEQQYRQHFTSWIFKVPNYSTIHPSSYDMLNRKDTQPEGLSETAEYFINLRKNRSPG